ncbi:MAG: HAD family hydrolase [Phycisphaerae bacterium]|nr:HAD family hydrolase [Phycisphaerae bacterium]
MAGRIRGVFFDLGDTLLNFGHVDVASLFESGAQLAYAYLQSLGKTLPSFASYHRSQLWAVRWGYFKSRVTGREFNARALITRLGRKMGHDLTGQQIDELAWLWYEPLSHCAAVERDLRGTLEQLSRGRTLGLISNTFIPASALDRHLRQANLLDLLPIRVYSCDVHYRKPHPAIFRIALERAHLPAEEAMFVGDSPVADVAGASRVGMVSVLKNPAGRYANGRIRADHTISRLSELPALVAGYDGG